MPYILENFLVVTTFRSYISKKNFNEILTNIVRLNGSDYIYRYQNIYLLLILKLILAYQKLRFMVTHYSLVLHFPLALQRTRSISRHPPLKYCSSTTPKYQPALIIRVKKHSFLYFYNREQHEQHIQFKLHLLQGQKQPHPDPCGAGGGG